MKITDLKPNEVIHCKTKEEAVRICGMMHEAGLKWASGTSYRFLKWSHGAKTCYRPSVGERTHVEYYLRENYTIYPSELFQDSPPSDEINEDGLRARGFKRHDWEDDGEKFHGWFTGTCTSPVCLEVNSEFKVELGFDDTYLPLPAVKTLTDIDHLIRLLGV